MSALLRPVLRRRPEIEAARRGLRTLRDLLRYAVSRFEAAGVAYGHGTDNAWDEAAWMVLWALHLPPDRLEPFLDATVLDAERDVVLELIERRCTERHPAAYLIGEAWLRGHRFIADQRALVPRSLIAEALDEGLDDQLHTEPATILDLCCGGGSIAILAAHRWPDATVTGSDASAEALAQATDNLALHELGHRVSLVRGDLYKGLAGRRFDLILCNPPYVSAARMATLPDEFTREPRDALDGGGDGMDLIRPILDRAPAHLEAGGGLLLEIGHERDHFEQAFPTLEFAWIPVATGENQLVWATRDQLSARR
jgi:ribosomal protein L3 glutamine methyltransferase